MTEDRPKKRPAFVDLLPECPDRISVPANSFSHKTGA